MADEVLPGIWWLHGTRGSNVYAFEVADGSLALVDTGFAASAAAVLAEVERFASGRTPSAILLTHGHGDHAGGAAALQAATGALVVAGQGDCEPGTAGEPARLAPHGGIHRRRGPKGRTSVAPVTVHRAVCSETEVLPGVLAVPVPGHTPGSLCFLVPEKAAAFVGDLVIVHGRELTRPLRRANADDAQYLQTLRTFAVRAPAHGLAGHGPPLLGSFGDDLRELAALPRRRATPLQHLTRMRRLATFGYRLGRRR